MPSLQLNRAMEENLPEFRRKMSVIRSQNPLPSGAKYYLYPTLDVVPKILSVLNRHHIDLLKYVESKDIADFGCGDGELSFFLEQFGPRSILASDWGPTNYNHMEACFVLKDLLGSKVILQNCDIHSLDFDALPQFDTIFCLGFLYHSPHPVWVLQKLAGKCRNLFLSSRIFDHPEAHVYFFDEYECNNDATNWWCYSPKALTLMLERSGFEVGFVERLDAIQLLSVPRPLAGLFRRVLVGNSRPVPGKHPGTAFIYAKSRLLNS